MQQKRTPLTVNQLIEVLQNLKATYPQWSKFVLMPDMRFVTGCDWLGETDGVMLECCTFEEAYPNDAQIPYIRKAASTP
jgi:hypothetical protein